MLEAFESRVVPAATSAVQFNAQTGLLTIFGDTSDNLVTQTADPWGRIRLTVDGQTLSADPGAADYDVALAGLSAVTLRAVEFQGGGGADRFVLGDLAADHDLSVRVIGLGATLDVAGTVRAAGGDVALLADRVTVEAGAVVDVSGPVAGTVVVGGDPRGRPDLPHSTNVTIDSGAVLRADGTAAGGRVVVWSDGVTDFRGVASARGAAGGFVEVSGANLRLTGTADAGPTGTVLLDPQNLVIGSGTDDATTSYLSPAALAGMSGGVILQADTDVTFAEDVTFGPGVTSLTVHAGRSVVVNAAVTLVAAAPVWLVSNSSDAVPGNRLAGPGDIRFSPAGSLSTPAGVVLNVDGSAPESPPVSAPFELGGVTVGRVTSGGAVTVYSGGSVVGAAADSALVGHDISISVATGAVGTATTPLRVDSSDWAADSPAYLSAAAPGGVWLTDTAGGVRVSAVDAGTADVSLSAAAGDLLFQAYAEVRGGNIALTAGGTVGTAAAPPRIDQAAGGRLDASAAAGIYLYSDAASGLALGLLETTNPDGEVVVQSYRGPVADGNDIGLNVRTGRLDVQAVGDVDLDTDVVRVAALTFDHSPLESGGGFTAPGDITIRDAGDLIVESATAQFGGIDVQAGGSLTVTAVETDAAGDIRLAAGGTLDVASAATAAGRVQASAGGAATVGTVTAAGDVSVSGSTVAAADIHATAGTITLTASTLGTELNGATIRADAGDVVFAGPVRVAGDSTVTPGGGYAVYFYAGLDLADATLTVGNAYLLLPPPPPPPDSSFSAFDAGDEASVLTGTGTVDGSLTVGAGGRIDPGHAGTAGALSVTTLTLTSDAVVALDLYGPADYDTLSSLAFGLGDASLEVTVAGYSPAAGEQYQVLRVQPFGDGMYGTFAQGNSVTSTGVVRTFGAQYDELAGLTLTAEAPADLTGFFYAVPSPTYAPNDQLTITFIAPVDPNTIHTSSFTLSVNGGTPVPLSSFPGVQLTILDQSVTTFVISGLSGPANSGFPPTTYTVAVAPGNTIAAQDGPPLTGTPDVTWVVDRPATASFDPVPDGRTPVDAVTVHFDQPVTGLTAADFTLYFGEGSLNLGGTGVQVTGSGGTYTLSGLAPYNDGSTPSGYTLTIQSVGGAPLSGTASVSWRVDAVAPTIAFESVPDTRDPVDSVYFTFDEYVANVDLGDFELNGVSLATLAGVGLINGEGVWQITGLAAYTPTGSPGTTYTISVAAGSDITDDVGNPLTRPAAVTWAVLGPVTGAWDPIPDATGPIDSATITFSTAVTDVELGDITLDGVRLDTLAGVQLFGSGSSYTVTGLYPYTSATTAGHTYTLLIGPASGIIDGTDSPLANQPAVTWTADLAPTLQLPEFGTVRTPVTDLTLTFSEPVTGVDLLDFTLNGVTLDTLAGVTIEQLSPTVYVVHGLGPHNASKDPAAVYTFAVAGGEGEGDPQMPSLRALAAPAVTIYDSAGNPLAGKASTSWQVDSAPTAAFDPVPTTAAGTDGVVITFDEPVLNVTLDDFTLDGVVLGGSAFPGVTITGDGTTYRITGLAPYTQPTQTGVFYTLAVRGDSDVADTTGNPLAAPPAVTWLADLPPVATWDMTDPANPVLTFNEPVLHFDLGDLALNGVLLSTFGVTLEALRPEVVAGAEDGRARAAAADAAPAGYVVRGLGGALLPGTAYTLGLAPGNDVTDANGNPVVGGSAVSFQTDPAPPSPPPPASPPVTTSPPPPVSPPPADGPVTTSPPPLFSPGPLPTVGQTLIVSPTGTTGGDTDTGDTATTTTRDTSEEAAAQARRAIEVGIVYGTDGFGAGGGAAANALATLTATPVGGVFSQATPTDLGQGATAAVPANPVAPGFLFDAALVATGHVDAGGDSFLLFEQFTADHAVAVSVPIPGNPSYISPAASVVPPVAGAADAPPPAPPEPEGRGWLWPVLALVGVAASGAAVAGKPRVRRRFFRALHALFH